MHTVGELFEAQAAKTPSAVALCCNDERVTYAALNARANRLARYLRRKGAQADTAIGVCMPYGVDLVAALLAVAKTGAAYVGVDRSWPRPWMAEALADSSAVLAIVDADVSDVPVRPGCEVVALRAHAADIAAESAENLCVVTQPDDLFSIVYSSGSTGKPKGVMVTARSVLNRMEWMWSAYPFHTRDVVLLYRSYASVGFSWDCFGALLQGVPTVIHPAADVRNAADIVRASAEHGVTHLTASAGFWDLILDEVERGEAGIPSLRLARTTGEPLRPETAERWRRVFPNVPLLNIYGTTECSGSLACDVSAIEPHGMPRVPVGAPVPGVQALVVDDDMRVLGEGEEGEVCIGGASLARGYLGGPAMTAERFVPSPASRAGDRVCRTGDLGFWRADGQLELIGRRDLQVKVRGFRVEIEAVEAALRGCAGVTGAAVRAEPDEGGARLVALLESNADTLGVREMRDALHARLPAYMVPAELLRVERLPRTANGKIDRRALRDIGGRPLDPSQSFAAPSSSSEAEVTAIWQQVLGIQTVGVDDDFFELGGHSLAAMRILTRVHKTFGIEVPLTAFFSAQTPKGLAFEIESARRRDVSAIE